MVLTHTDTNKFWEHAVGETQSKWERSGRTRREGAFKHTDTNDNHKDTLPTVAHTIQDS